MSDLRPVYCDITELVSNPTRSGIQRVVRAFLKSWPGPRPLKLCRFFNGELIELPAECSYYLLETDAVVRSESVTILTAKLAALLENYPAKPVSLGETIAIVELFFDEARCKHYLWRLESYPESIHLFYHDFIPWLQPDAIGVERSTNLMWYIRLAKRVRHAAFNSRATLDDWRHRILRDSTRSGAVLPLGADGLQITRQHFSIEKTTYVALGSVDGRKNQDVIMSAFEQLWEEGLDVGLTIIGKIFDSERDMLRQIEAMSRFPRFRHCARATDDEISEIFATARATIYASATEGYGLPPVESLAVGIPCIASNMIPSLENVDGGICILAEISPSAIATHVRRLDDDCLTAELWHEAAGLSLPTWEEFGSTAAQWIGDR